MKRQTEINGFAIFLICSLVPLVSLAPTVTSEGKITTTGQKHFTTSIKTLASVLETHARTMFEKYNACSPVTPQTIVWLKADSQATAMVRAIPECPAFNANCCAFHVFYKTLQNLRNEAEGMCNATAPPVDASLRQLEVVLSEGAELYACRSEDLPQVDAKWSQMKTTQKMTYIWLVLQKYDQFMQNTTKRYNALYARMKK